MPLELVQILIAAAERARRVEVAEIVSATAAAISISMAKNPQRALAQLIDKSVQ